MIARVLERGTRAVRADRATLSSLVDAEVVIEATFGRPGNLTWVGQHYSRDYLTSQPLVHRAIESLEPTFGGQLVVGEAAPVFRDALAQVRHTAVMPLVFGGKAIGMLVLSRYEDPAFDADDLAALSLLSTISGLALRNARLYESARAAEARADATAARLRAAVDSAEEVASQVELDRVLGSLLRRAANSVGADEASLARLEGRHLILESTTGRAPIGSRWPIPAEVLSGLKKGHAVQLGAQEYTGTPSGLETVVQPFRRFLVAPLFVARELIGLITMGRSHPEPFKEDDIAGLQQFSTLGALLLRNARLIAQTRDAERSKTEFMNTAVHALRAPLTVTGGYISMALEGGFGDLPAPLHRVLETAQRKTDEAKQLANELLAVARMEGNAIAPEREHLSVPELIQEAVVRARPRAEFGHAELRVERAPELAVVGDRGLVATILDNLINNALSYTDHPPTVVLSARREGDEIALTVTDDGSGITSEDRERIFNRFVRGSDAGVREHPGSGLGLYLSRGLAEQMRGSLGLISSDPGKGSSFELRLPAAID